MNGTAGTMDKFTGSRAVIGILLPDGNKVRVDLILDHLAIEAIMVETKERGEVPSGRQNFTLKGEVVDPSPEATKELFGELN